MRYTKMLGFYFFEFLSGLLNFVFCIFGMYPSLDLGVRFLMAVESGKITQQHDQQRERREKHETDAKAAQTRAERNDGQNV